MAILKEKPKTKVRLIKSSDYYPTAITVLEKLTGLSADYISMVLEEAREEFMEAIAGGENNVLYAWKLARIREKNPYAALYLITKYNAQYRTKISASEIYEKAKEERAKELEQHLKAQVR